MFNNSEIPLVTIQQDSSDKTEQEESELETIKFYIPNGNNEEKENGIGDDVDGTTREKMPAGHNQNCVAPKAQDSLQPPAAVSGRFTVERVPLKVSPFCTLGPTAVRSPSVVRFDEQATVNSCMGLLQYTNSHSVGNAFSHSHTYSHTYGFGQLGSSRRRPSVTGGPLPQYPARCNSLKNLPIPHVSTATSSTGNYSDQGAPASIELLPDQQHSLEDQVEDDVLPIDTLIHEDGFLDDEDYYDSFGDLCLLCPRKHIEGELYEWLLPASSALHSQRLPCDCHEMRYVHVECLDREFHAEKNSLSCPWCSANMTVHRRRQLLCQYRKLFRHFLELAIVLSIVLVFVFWSLLINGLKPLNGTLLCMCVLAMVIFLVLKLRNVCGNFSYNITRSRRKSSVLAATSSSGSGNSRSHPPSGDEPPPPVAV